MRDGSDLRAVSQESGREEHSESWIEMVETPLPLPCMREENSPGRRRAKAQASRENISTRKRNKNLINTLPLPMTEI